MLHSLEILTRGPEILSQGWFLQLRTGQRPHTCDIWVWTESEGAVIVSCWVKAVRCHVARYRVRKVEEVHHILSDFAVPRLISCTVPRPIAIWVETFNAWREVDLGHGGRSSGLGGRPY